MPPSPKKSEKRAASGERKKFGRKWSSRSDSLSPSGSASSGSEAGVTAPSPGGMVTGVTTARMKGDFEFKGGENDIVGLVMLEIQGADDLPRLANSMCLFSSFLQPFILFIYFSDPHGMGHGPLCRHLLWQESVSYSRHPTLAQPRLGRKATLPRPEIRNFVQGATYRPRLGQTLEQRSHRGRCIGCEGVDRARSPA